MFCLPLFPFLCGFWDFFQFIQKVQVISKNTKRTRWNLHLILKFELKNWNKLIGMISFWEHWHHGQQIELLQDHHAQQKDTARTSEKAETTETDATEQQKEPEQERPENAAAREDLARRGCRANQTANARTASGRSSGASKLRMARNWRQWSQTAWIRSERRADGKTERKRENSRKRADGDMRGDCSRIGTNARTSLERRSGDVSFACSEWHVLSTYF